VQQGISALVDFVNARAGASTTRLWHCITLICCRDERGLCEALGDSKQSLVYFYSSKCLLCRSVAPSVEQVRDASLKGLRDLSMQQQQQQQRHCHVTVLAPVLAAGAREVQQLAQFR
jgi:hypothetical protein